MIYFIASAGILILLIGYIISTYNRLVSNKNSLDESFSTMDVYLKKRWDLNKLIAVAENYPELKANENFLDLSHELKNTEQDIANARKYYNANVKVYNNQVMIFPSNIIAKIFKFEKASMFEIEETERQNVKVEF